MHPRDVAATVFVTAVWGVAFVGLKEVVAHGPPLTLAGARFVLGGALLVPLARRRAEAPPSARRRPRPLSRGEILLVALLQTTALYGLGFLGIQRTSAGASALLLNTNPVMVALLAWPMLGERTTAGRLIALGVGFVGVVIVIRPGTELFQWASLFVVWSAVCYALYQVLTRRIAGIDSPETSAIYSSIVGAFGLILTLPFVWKTPHTVRDIAYFCSLGVLGALGHYCVARAMSYAPANIVSPFQYMQLLGSVAVGYLFFGDFPDFLGWVGAATIVSAGLYIGWSQRRQP